MPELPEVETIAEYLRKGKDGLPLEGQVICSAEVLWERSLAEPRLEEFNPRIAGQKICRVGRRAKFLKIELDRDVLLVHLRMSGDLRVEREQVGALAQHDRVVLHLEGGWRLVFNDTRKFGRVWLVSDAQDVLGGLGPEPLEAEFSADGLFGRLQGHPRQLKPLLLDQAFLAGLGNIYTDEALNLARLNPNRRANGLSREEAERLWVAIRAVLAEGIRRHGASIDWVYRGGDFQNSFRVYQRTGQPCPECGTAIRRVVVGQRGTHYCPTCQPEPN